MSVGPWPFSLTGKFSARPQSETRLPATDSSSARWNECKPNGWRMPLTLAADASRGQSEGLIESNGDRESVRDAEQAALQINALRFGSPTDVDHLSEAQHLDRMR